VIVLVLLSTCSVCAVAPQPAELPRVAIVVHGDAAEEQAAFLAQRLAGRYRVVGESEAQLFIDVTSDGDVVRVEVRDALGTLSVQEVSTQEDQRDVLVWLVVRSALERAEEPDVAAASAPPVAAPPDAPDEGHTWGFVVPALSASGVLASGQSLALEGGPRAAVTFTFVEHVDTTIDVGYRRQSAGPVTAHALPLAFSIAPRVSIADAVALSAGARAEVAPKWLEGYDVRALEWSVGPTATLRVPLAALPLALVVEGGVAAKVRRQGYVVGGALVEESPWRASVALGVEARWD
jgi:hypothetical protein